MMKLLNSFYGFLQSMSFKRLYRLAMRWGFQYRTVGFVWDTIQLVPGFYTFAQCQLCLIFKNWKHLPKPRGKGEHQTIPILQAWQAQRQARCRLGTRISQSMFPTPRYTTIELFARGER